ncbi:hypothetical protein CLCOS_36490 [Clostridium coskatii]|uniref:HTH cro/C1-type domain-containing protein n=1 Tax=Clostridium coskatii TaxID=1705578 RepID=A0A168R7J2_9CLOT|nr:hypothetical protein WX73_02115 [Clostridium coskatii]OBR91071.1 hypothetical protein CLCOS_36490 [Clostridium coskatii]
MYEQEVVRRTLVRYCTKWGVKYNHIARTLHLSKCTISHFVNGDRNLRKINFDNLVSLLKKVNYL